MESNINKKLSAISFYSFLIGLIWTILLTILFFWNIGNIKEHINDLATHQARAFFQEIVTTRYWNANHGGVYVPITEDTQPNPYLEVADRDVITVDSVKLTKINPAYMTRQIGEIAKERNLVWFHITSANPIRPANVPDSWETSILDFFSSGVKEHSEFILDPDSKQLFRYMAPLWTERPCLTCHASQGYKEGDLRGGISVSIQAEPFLTSQNQQILQQSYVFIILWLLGLIGIGFVYSRLNKNERLREGIILKLEKALVDVHTLRGFLPICASCKKIRDDKGYWNQVEEYICEHSEAQFTHSICPECRNKIFPKNQEEE